MSLRASAGEENAGGDLFDVEELRVRSCRHGPEPSCTVVGKFQETSGINECVYLRIQRPRLLTVAVRAGTGTRRYKVVKSDNPEDLVFQSVSKGAPMRDNNILTRHIKPAARKMGVGFVNWRCLRTSHATWLKMAGADVKDAQAQMRHSRSSTTLDIYQQFVPESQQRAVEKLSSLSKRVQ
jgi:integrase